MKCHKAHIAAEFVERHHQFKPTSIYRYLQSEGFSLKADKKNIEGDTHPDRDLQFRYLSEQCRDFEAKQCPVISVDCKKNELIGNFKNHGRE